MKPISKSIIIYTLLILISLSFLSIVIASNRYKGDNNSVFNSFDSFSSMNKPNYDLSNTKTTKTPVLPPKEDIYENIKPTITPYLNYSYLDIQRCDDNQNLFTVESKNETYYYLHDRISPNLKYRLLKDDPQFLSYENGELQIGDTISFEPISNCAKKVLVMFCPANDIGYKGKITQIVNNNFIKIHLVTPISKDLGLNSTYNLPFVFLGSINTGDTVSIRVNPISCQNIFQKVD